MDTFTQVLLGASIGAAAFHRRLGKRAIVIGGLGGLIPDLDLVSSLAGPWASLVHHRGLTHSLFFAPVVSLPLGWLSHRWTTKRTPTPPVGASPAPNDASVGVHAQLWFWSIFTHPLLDLFTTYGTQLLWPFSNRRFSLDGVSIIDPVYSVPLLIAVIVGWRAGAEWRRAQRVATAALVLTTSWLFAGWGIGTSIERRAAERWPTEPFEEVRAIPSFANLLYWRVIARTATGDIHVDFYSLRAGWDGRTAVLPALDHPAVDTVRATYEGQILTWFSEGWMGWVWEEGAEGRVLWAEDQRYGSYVEPTRSMMAGRIEWAEDGVTLRSIEWVQDRRAELDVGAELRAVGRGIIGRGGMP